MKSLSSLSLGLLCWVGLIGPPLATADSPIYVGILEGPQTHEPPISSQRHVRIAFRKQGSTWLPMDSHFGSREALAEASNPYPDKVDWTVVFDGESVGHISSRNPGPLHWYADIGTQIITTNPADVPTISVGASDFAYTSGSAKTRPLLLVSEPNFRDPEHWKPTMLSVTERQLAVQALRKQIPEMPQCEQPEQGPEKMLPYSDDEIIIIKAYRSANDEVIFGERLDGARSICGWFNDEHFFDYWFVLNSQGLRLLGHQMMPMEAADLDNGGTSEWVFHSLRGEDQEGYELFYDDFAKQEYFHWTEH
jgi:hypothetical protein